MFRQRIDRTADIVGKGLGKALDAAIARGIDGGRTYGEIADDIRVALGISPDDPTFPGWRAERIARTEAMWAINEGMRQQYQAVGIGKVNVDIAPSACDKCVSVAQGNPYTLDEASGLLPAHSNCRCVLTGDYTNLLS